MIFFGKNNEKRLVAQAETDQRPAHRAWRTFRQNRLALISLRILYALIFIAVFADFLANEKPLFCRLDGKTYFPILKQYATDLGLAKRDPVFFQKDWSEHDFSAVIFPPIPYSATTIDGKNGGYVSPFERQNVASWRFRHWLGTDHVGHDTLAGLVAGTRVALLVGLVAMSIAAGIGILFGALAGYFGDAGFRVSRLRFWVNLIALFFAWFYAFQVRNYAISEVAASGGAGWELLKSLGIFTGIMAVANGLVELIQRTVSTLSANRSGSRMTMPLDLMVMRLVEMLNSIPGFLLLLALVAVLQKSSIFWVMAIIGLIRWTSIARYVRAEMLKVKNLGYVEAARALGFSNRRILFRHALPNVLPPAMVTIAFGIASAILLESTLTFLGIGLSGEEVTWGSLLAKARIFPGAWWLAVFPGAAIFVTVTVFNLLGEGLTEALAPR